MSNNNDTCPCGATVCANQDKAFFYRRTRPTRRNVRAVVFLWPYRRVWTWCPVVDGEPRDHGFVMGHYDNLQSAFAHAYAWVLGEYGSTREEVAA